METDGAAPLNELATRENFSWTQSQAPRALAPTGSLCVRGVDALAVNF